jgi:hypothetical protein
MRRAICSLVAVLATAVAANAGIIYQSIPNLTVNPAVNAWCSSCFGNFQVFDTFSVSSGQIVKNIKFNVQTSYFFPTPVTVSIWSVVGGLPGSQIFSQTFTPGQFLSVVNNPGVDTSTVEVSPTGGWLLPTGTYDISFFNPSNLGVPGYTKAGGVLYQSGIGFHNDQSAGFILAGDPATVPEPVSMLVFGGLLAAGGLAARRRMKVAA